MVCLGNICRSPLAHGVLQHLADSEGLDWVVDSAGTGGWHVGEPPDDRAVAVAGNHGIDISCQRAQQFNPRHFDEYDHILVMDRENLNRILALAESQQQRSKVRLFLEDSEVPDPYFDSRLFELVYQQIEIRCRELLRILGK